MLQVHERIGEFEIIRLLGKGGMGEVYEARQFNPQRSVALKVLAPWLAADEDSLQRFWREAQVPANLDHPGIVRIISMGKTDSGTAYYTMHLVRGISLAELIRQSFASPGLAQVTRVDRAGNAPSLATRSEDKNASPLSLAPDGQPTTPMLCEYTRDRYRTVARIGAQAARALAYAHRQGFLHRDIKPSNLMVDQHNQVYLVDFGLTRALNPAGNGTLPGVVSGTPWYMSPEQADGKDLDSGTDIYSLGITLYELATQGFGPFTADRKERSAVLLQVRAGQLISLRSLAPDIPRALERIILRAMHHDPKKRYADAGDLAKDLEALCERSTEESTRDLSAAETTHPLPRETGRRRWPFALAAVIVALLIVVTAATAPFWRAMLGNGAENKDGQNALPEILRQTPVNGVVSLLKKNAEPLWAERLFGNGKYTPRAFPNQLELHSPRNENCTILALADPNRSAFEIAIELNQMESFNPLNTNDLGLIIGWQRQAENAGEHPRFFVIQLDERPAGDHAHGRVTIGTAWIVKKEGLRGETVEWFKPLPGDKAIIPLAASRTWHTLKVEVHNERVQVSVDRQPVKDFTLTWLREADGHAATNLRPQGTVAIWVSRGRGVFRNARVTPLAAE